MAQSWEMNDPIVQEQIAPWEQDDPIVQEIGQLEAGVKELGKGLISSTIGVAKQLVVQTAADIISAPGEYLSFVAPELGAPKAQREKLVEPLAKMKQNMTEAQEIFKKSYTGGGAWVGRIIGEAIPYMGAALAGGYVAGLPGAAMVGFAVEGGNAYDEAIASGATEAEAQTERAIVGSINAAIEAVQIGRLMKFHATGKHSLKSFIASIKNKVYKKAGKQALGFTGDVLKLSIEEGLEEFAQEGVSVATPAILRGEMPRKADGSPDLWAIALRLGEAALGGAVAGGILGGGGAAISASMDRQTKIIDKVITAEKMRDVIEQDESLTPEQKTEAQNYIGDIETEIINDIAEVFPGAIVNQESLEEMGNRIADYLGVQENITWQWSDRKTRRRKGWIDPVTKTMRIYGPLHESALEIKETIVHELGHLVREPYVDATTGKRRVHSPEFEKWVSNNVHQLTQTIEKVIPKADEKTIGPVEVKQIEPSKKPDQRPLTKEKIKPRKLSRKRALVMGHRIPDALGWTEEQRREFNKRITNQSSMKNMTAAQRAQIVTALQKEAETAGIEIEGLDITPTDELIMKLEERKQKPALTRRDRRNMKKLRKAFHMLKAGTSFYFLQTTRIKRLCSALDNYEKDGPFTKYIYQPVKDADTEANVRFTEDMVAAVNTMNDLGVNAADMIIEIKDIGIKDKLTTSQRIGVWALAQNNKALSHLLSEFSEEEIAKIIDSVNKSKKELAVAAEVQTYFENGWNSFKAVAEKHGISNMVKEANYITAFVADKNDLDEPNFLEGIMQEFTTGTFIPGKQHTIKRKGGKRSLELDIFVIHSRAARALERFKIMAPVSKDIGRIINDRKFKQAINDVTYGHGSRLLDKWLQDSIRGQAAFDRSALAPALRWLRMAGINFVLNFKILTAGKQGVSLLPAMGIDPGMIPLVFANLGKAAIPTNYQKMQDLAMGKSGLLRTRDWNRDLRQVWNKKAVRKLYASKGLSPASMRMATWVDRHTCTVVWTSAYQLAEKHDMSEDERIRFADGVIEKTQPMGKAVDLPGFFRGTEFQKSLTVFQNQVNQNFNMFVYDILGEAKTKKISPQMAMYRLLFSHGIPALMLGMITRGRPPETIREIAEDMLFYILCPFVFVGRLAYNAVTEQWGPTRMIMEEPFVETERLIGAIRGGKPREIVKYSARAIGAWSGGKIPLQAISTAEGAYDLTTGETEDFRRLVWSKYALERKGKKRGRKSKKGFQ